MMTSLPQRWDRLTFVIARVDLLTSSSEYLFRSDLCLLFILCMHLAATFCMIMQVAKNAFVIFYSGEKAKAKILKICDAFSANRYPFPEDVAKQIHAVQEVST